MFKDTPAFSSFSVDDMEKAKEFYGKILGIHVSQTKEGLNLEITGGNSVFIYPKPNHVPATYTVLNFQVEDISKTVEELDKVGIHLEHYEGMHADEQGIVWGAKVGQGPNIAWFKDPAGNILSMLADK